VHVERVGEPKPIVDHDLLKNRQAGAVRQQGTLNVVLLAIIDVAVERVEHRPDGTHVAHDAAPECSRPYRGRAKSPDLGSWLPRARARKRVTIGELPD